MTASEGRPSTKRPIVVVHLLHTMAYGGVETILINWLKTLDGNDIRAHLVVFRNPRATEEPFVRAAEMQGLTVHKIPWSRRKPILAAARSLARILRDTGADILHAHNTYADVVGWVASRRVPVKTVTTLYVWSDFGWKRNVLQWIDQQILKWYDLITTQCQQTLEDSIARGLPRERLKLLISGYESDRQRLSPEERRLRRAKMGAGEGDTVLINVARFYPEKRQALLIRSFRKLRDRYPNVHLWMLGVGPLEGELRRVCSELELNDAVRFLSFVENLSEVLQLADIQVHPSAAEGVPLAVCAGMAVGLPVVATAVGGLPEIITHEVSGLLVPAPDECGLTEAVSRLIEGEPERRRLGREARRFIEEDYSLTVAVDVLARTYRELLSPCGSVSS